METPKEKDMSTPPLDVAMPQLSLKVLEAPQPDGTIRELLMLVVETSVTHYETFIADAHNYRDVAKKIADGIITLGNQMKRGSQLIEVKGALPDGLNPGLRNGRRK